MRILLVEDDAGITKFIRQGLAEAGYATDVATNGAEGLELALTVDYDLILLDVMLPLSDGIRS